MDYKYNDIVLYDDGVSKMQARVVGVATTGSPVIGKSYIMEDLSGQLPSNTYPYKFFAGFEVHMKAIVASYAYS